VVEKRLRTTALKEITSTSEMNVIQMNQVDLFSIWLQTTFMVTE